MSVLCDLALVFGLTLGGTCQPATPVADPMPPNDAAAWSYKEPAPKPEEPKPQPAANFPPIVIKQEVIREVPAPVQAPPPAPKPVAKVKEPSAVELALRAAYRDRAAGASLWSEVAVPASFGGNGAAGMPAGASQMPVSPLDLAGVASRQGEPRYQADGVVSTLPVDNERILAADRYITGNLETGINTQLDGTTGSTLVIQTTRDVYGYHGRNVLLPKGSRLLCEYQSPDKLGETRAAVRCGRVLLGESRAEILGIKANVTDAQGYLGVSGEVDTRFVERFGTAFILAGISATVRAATASTQSLEFLSDKSDALSTGGEELSKNLGNIAASSLEQTINLAPILKVAQGTRVQIRPAEDWYIQKVE
jgi:type IV secretion system protein VirB10